MRATGKSARALEQMARDFNHPLLPKKGGDVIKISAAYLADLVERVERLEQQQEVKHGQS